MSPLNYFDNECRVAQTGDCVLEEMVLRELQLLFLRQPALDGMGTDEPVKECKPVHQCINTSIHTYLSTFDGSLGRAPAGCFARTLVWEERSSACDSSQAMLAGGLTLIGQRLDVPVALSTTTRSTCTPNVHAYLRRPTCGMVLCFPSILCAAPGSVHTQASAGLYRARCVAGAHLFYS